MEKKGRRSGARGVFIFFMSENSTHTLSYITRTSFQGDTLVFWSVFLWGCDNKASQSAHYYCFNITLSQFFFYPLTNVINYADVPRAEFQTPSFFFFLQIAACGADLSGVTLKSVAREVHIHMYQLGKNSKGGSVHLLRIGELFLLPLIIWRSRQGSLHTRSSMQDMAAIRPPFNMMTPT